MKSLRARVMHFVRYWHARIGVFAAVFFLLLCLSGVALNHTDALRLDRTQVQASWLMRWYGLKPNIPSRGFVFDKGYFAATDERWVLNGIVLPEQDGFIMKQTLSGATAWNEMYAVAGSDDLFLFMPDGRQVDHLNSSMLPATPIERVGVITGEAHWGLVLKTGKGQYFSEDVLSWKLLDPKDNRSVVWAQEAPLPDTLSDSLRKAFSLSLPLERVVLDLHSGRIFGRHGPLLMDLVALILMILSLSGLWIYIRSVRRRPKR